LGGDLSDSCCDVAVDKNGRIYALCEPLSGADYKIMRFPPYTNAPLTKADWKTDNDSASTDPYAIAVNPPASYVAVARTESKSVWILDANTGAMVTTISSNGFPHYAVAWDNVGNVYSCFDGESNSVWQAWSPPGTNQATTYGLQTIRVVVAPTFTGVVPNGSNLVLKFTGPANAPLSVFTVLSGEAPTGITNVVTDAVVTGSNGLFQALVLFNGPRQFYRIEMSALTSGIYITRIRTFNGTVALDFAGSADDAPSAFRVLSGAVPTGITNVAPAAISGTNGVFAAIISAGEPRQFYRIQR
jgi:hypothetical protein